MPRYLLKIKAKDKKTGRLRNLWCVFSTVVMSCISPIVEARDVEEAKRALRRFKYMGISDIEREAIRMGYLTEEEVKKHKRVGQAMRAEPERTKELTEEYWDLFQKYASAIEEVERRLGVKGYNDRYVEEIKGEVEDNRVTAWMTVYVWPPPGSKLEL